jgi:hypothetical protein
MDVEDDDLPFPEFPSEARLRAEPHTHHRTRLLLGIIANAPHITRYTRNHRRPRNGTRPVGHEARMTHTADRRVERPPSRRRRIPSLMVRTRKIKRY